MGRSRAVHGGSQRADLGVLVGSGDLTGRLDDRRVAAGCQKSQGGSSDGRVRVDGQTEEPRLGIDACQTGDRPGQFDSGLRIGVEEVSCQGKMNFPKPFLFQFGTGAGRFVWIGVLEKPHQFERSLDRRRKEI